MGHPTPPGTLNKNICSTITGSSVQVILGTPVFQAHPPEGSIQVLPLVVWRRRFQVTAGGRVGEVCLNYLVYALVLPLGGQDVSTIYFEWASSVLPLVTVERTLAVFTYVAAQG